MAAYYPPVAFHFRVDLKGLPPNAGDAQFSDVEGLSVELASEEVPEGGENRFVQRYPLRAKYPDLVLKRGLFKNSEILRWVEDCITTLVVAPKDIDVTLLNEDRQPLVTWHIVKAWPTRWSLGALSATANAVAVESLQFAYQYFTVERA